MADKLPFSAYIPFESTYEKDHHNYLTLFDNHAKGNAILIGLRSVLRMRMEKDDLPTV